MTRKTQDTRTEQNSRKPRETRPQNGERGRRPPKRRGDKQAHTHSANVLAWRGEQRVTLEGHWWHGLDRHSSFRLVGVC